MGRSRTRPTVGPWAQAAVIDAKANVRAKALDGGGHDENERGMAAPTSLAPDYSASTVLPRTSTVWLLLAALGVDRVATPRIGERRP